MSNELIVPDITVTTVPTGVINVTPPAPAVVVTGNVAVTNFPAVQVVSGTVNLATEPTIDIGIVDQGTPGTAPWPVSISTSLTATVTAISVGTSSTSLLSTNAARKGFAIQNTTDTVFIKLGTSVTTALYSYELPRKGILEVENYRGPVTAVSGSGSIIVMVTEKV